MNQIALSPEVATPDDNSSSDAQIETPVPQASGFALFLDFDGTLVDIAESPEAIVVPADLSETLINLRDALGGALAIVTGRSIAVIDRFLSPNLFDVAGIHGAEWRLGEEMRQAHAEGDFQLKDALVEMRERLSHHPELLIEDKGGSVALHWRQTPHLASLAIDVLKKAAKDLGPGYRLQHGKSVAELLPAGVSKERAIAQFMTMPPYAGRHPIFIGDDLTDESGFEIVNALQGTSMRVGSGPTLARQRLATPTQVRRLLGLWATSGRINLNEDLPE